MGGVGNVDRGDFDDGGDLGVLIDDEDVDFGVLVDDDRGDLVLGDRDFDDDFSPGTYSGSLL